MEPKISSKTYLTVLPPSGAARPLAGGWPADKKGILDIMEQRDSPASAAASESSFEEAQRLLVGGPNVAATATEGIHYTGIERYSG